MNHMTWLQLASLCTSVLIATGLLSYLLSFVSRRWAIQFRALDIPKSPRKIHKEPVPLWGGVGIALTLGIVLLLVGLEGSIFNFKISGWQLIGFLVGLAVLNLGGMLDDRYDLKAWQSILFPVTAALAVILTGTSIVHVTSPGTATALYLNWWTWHPFRSFWGFAFPSDLLTFIWLLMAIYAMKITDGLDGLVSGITVIGSAMVGILSVMPIYFQPASAILAAAVAGTYLGFLPRNTHPAKQFLGEGGSTIAGFCLGFLAIVSSAKIAIALAVLAIPVADIAFVVLRRILSGHSPFSGDSSHLHFRLLAAGIPHRAAVILLWVVSASAGIIALTLQTRGKIFLIVLMVLLAYLISWAADRIIRRRALSSEAKK